MDENVLPKLLENRIDLKSITFSALDASLDVFKSGKIEEISIGKNTRVIILTSFGIVEGNPIKKSITESDTDSPDLVNTFSTTLLDNVFKIRNSEIQKLETQNPEFKLINDSSAILLSDVSVTPYSNPNAKSNLRYLILFTEDIKALSFGEMS